MPPTNNFRHQRYTDECPTAAFHSVKPRSYPEVETQDFVRRMQLVGDVYRSAGVSVIYLIHGTFVGGDAAGLWTELSRWLPRTSNVLRPISKKWIDAAVGEQGNYTQRFASMFEKAINYDDRRKIVVRLFSWSSENHHVGRADAAVRLLDELDRLPQPQRVMLWGHSHAGNVFALLTNLLGADDAALRAFFDAARIYYGALITRRHFTVWPHMLRRLNSSERPLADTKCDFVTFGTPIRYGWDTNGYSQLLHFVNHQPAAGIADYLTRFPNSLDDVLQACHGDYIQHFGIAGTNILPGILSWRSFWADRRLNNLLQPDFRVRDLYTRLKLGMRVPDEGTTLLVDYGPAQGNVSQHHAGHAIYTQLDWLLFHAEQTAGYLYESVETPVN